MAEIALITNSEVQEYRRISSSFDATRFDGFVKEAQRKNLRGLLGDALYYAFMLDARTSGIYKDLLDGKIYTYNNNSIEYYGIKPYLIYIWLSIACREGDLFVANVGAIDFVNNPQQNFESAKSKEKIASDYMQTAQGYGNDIIKFLNENASDYPLWSNTDENNITEFITFKF